MQETRGWDSAAFGREEGAEVFLNVYVFFLIFAGIILDKMGVRFTAVLSGVVMLVGGAIKFYAVSDAFIGSGLETWFTNHLNWNGDLPILGDVLPFVDGMPASAKLAACGFMIFGSGCEMAGITVSRGIVKWFKGRETALAMGSEMALARLGVATCMIFSPFFAKLGGSVNVSRSVAFGVVLLCIALIMTIVYFFMDKKLDDQTGEAEEKDDPFKLSDLGKIFTSQGFWLVALLCVLYYSAIFPFQKYAVNMLQCNLTLNPAEAGTFWAGAGNSVTIVQYIIMLVVAICAFSSNFSKNKGLKLLKAKNIECKVIPGVSSFFAAAAAVQAEYTLPDVSQTVIISRMEGRTPVPERESIRNLASHKSSMVLFLSSGMLKALSRELIAGGYDESTPAALVYKASWPDEKIIRTSLKNLASDAEAAGINKTALVLVGEFLNDKEHNNYKLSKLYDEKFSHGFREAKA